MTNLQVADVEECYLSAQYKLTYLHGTGRQFLPVLIPVDCVAAVELLIQHRSENNKRRKTTLYLSAKVCVFKGLCVQRYVCSNVSKQIKVFRVKRDVFLQKLTTEPRPQSVYEDLYWHILKLQNHGN